MYKQLINVPQQTVIVGNVLWWVVLFMFPPLSSHMTKTLLEEFLSELCDDGKFSH